MRTATLTAALVAGLVFAPPPTLKVLRVAPTDDGEPTSVVSVTFDRPVAGQLDGTIDARRIFTILPAAAGRVEWRDPITLRFTPSAPLRSGVAYAITIANTFSAMDGARLEQPYHFTFRVGGPRVLAASPADPRADRRYLHPDAQFALVVSAPVALPMVAAQAVLNLEQSCGAATPVALRAISQRPITARDPSSYREAGGWQRDTRNDPLRRVVRLAPERALPAGCRFALVTGERIEAGRRTPERRYDFATYGPLRLASISCSNQPQCPAGWVKLEFSTPVRGTEVLRAAKISGPTTFTVSDSTDESASWYLEAPLRPRTAYTVSVDTTLHDAFGQHLAGPQQGNLTTTGYAPSLEYAAGSMLVERQGFRTIAVKHVNVDTIFATYAPVPESLEAKILAAPQWNIADVMPLLAAGGTTRAIAVHGATDTPLLSAIRVPAYNAARDGGPTLTAIRLARSRGDTSRSRGVILTQVTNLGVAARLGAEEAVVWVTRVDDGRAVAGAQVELHGRRGQVRGRGTTDAQGLVRLTALDADTAPHAADEEERSDGDFEGYVAVTLESDRALVPFNSYAWELSPWRFNVTGADNNDRLPAAAAVFTERGIYRPGETVYAKAIVRTGNLGALRVPARRDSVRWVFADRENGTIRDTIVTVSTFGTAEQAMRIPGDLALGTYRIGVSLRRNGAWAELASAFYRVAEYRPPEFLVGVSSDTAPHFAGDTVTASVEARYLFGAPMGRAAMTWMVRRTTIDPWALQIPGTDGYAVGETGWWWEDVGESSPNGEVTANGTDTLDAAGRLTLRVGMGTSKKGRPARVSIQATVTDVNRQAVSSSASVTLHPAAFYIGAKTLGEEYFWRANTAQDIALIAVTPDGRTVPGVAIRGTLVRQEWHRVQRSRGGLDEDVGGWVPDTLAHCDITTGAEPGTCRFTPPQGGSYIVSFRARDDAGRAASTSFYRWATGRGWVPWGDETQLRMDLIPDRTRYDVGDTATVLLASPFTDAEAWITLEREGIIEQRRMRITAGATSLKFVLTEAHVPNVFVSAVVVRGRSAAPGGIGDPGRPALRVGYAELRVTPRVKRLAVTVQPLAMEYRPADSARVHLSVRDAAGAGRRSEVTLWAVDEGVLSLTGYRTPDPVDLIYQPRGVAMRLRSDLVSVAAQVLAEEGVSIKGQEEPGGGGGQAGSDILRSRFSSTAFFLGSVVTDSAGEATAAAKLPDNLTTFRVMAVAVTAGDRYGSGQSSMLVTRPLLARPALPRFLRRDDHFVAGVIVNQRSGTAAPVRVRAASRGVAMSDSATRSVTLEPGRGREVRFAFRDTTADSASFRFDVTNGQDSDAVLTKLPVRPSHVPRAWTASGVARNTSPVELTLPANIDPERSQLVFGVGTTPLAIIGGMYRQLAVYPFDCSEQVTSELMPLVALFRASSAPGAPRVAPADARAQIEAGVAVLTRRQRADGGIGLWSADDWTSPWLSAWAGEALLAARDAGIPVRDSVLGRLGDYLYRNVHQWNGIQAPIASWFSDPLVRLAEDVAAADYLSRLGRPDVPAENDLLRRAGLMAWEDRARLAEVLARRGEMASARRLLEPMWAKITIEGRRAVLPDSAVRSFYFWSRQRPAARMLSATLAVDSTHALIGPLVETLVQTARGTGWWNTQDYGAAIEALSDFTARQQRAARRGFTVTAGGQEIYRSTGPGDVLRETTRNLAGLLTTAADSSRRLAVTVTAQGSGAPLFYYITVNEVPLQRPVTPDQQGIQVERWYEDYNTGRPIQSAVEGSLVRVRLRVRFTAERRFLALTDPLPAGLEAVDLSLRTSGALPGPAAHPRNPEDDGQADGEAGPYPYNWYFGSWDSGWWSPFDHRELRDDRVAYVATYLWPGTYTATYVARATTPGVFIRPPAHAEEMYNPSVQGRSDGGTFTVTPTP